jgi:hypothetical protein
MVCSTSGYFKHSNKNLSIERSGDKVSTNKPDVEVETATYEKEIVNEEVVDATGLDKISPNLKLQQELNF